MIRRERCKIAKKLNESLKINIYKDFVFHKITHNGLQILGGILIGPFNSPDSFRPFASFIPLFIPDDAFNVSYGHIMRHYKGNQEEIAIEEMTIEYNKFIAPIQNFNDVDHGLNYKIIPNGASSLLYTELQLYVSLILEKYNEFFDNIQNFKIISTTVSAAWKFPIIQRVTLIENIVRENGYKAACNQLIQWQNFTIKALKLPLDLEPIR